MNAAGLEAGETHAICPKCLHRNAIAVRHIRVSFYEIPCQRCGRIFRPKDRLPESVIDQYWDWREEVSEEAECQKT